MISRLEVIFALPVELSSEERQSLDRFVGRICDRHTPEGWVHWPSGYGSAPIWREPEEPDWDDEVYRITTCAREAYPSEIERDRKREEEKRRRQARFWFRVGILVEDIGYWIRRHS